jgi:hypothetical protein
VKCRHERPHLNIWGCFVSVSFLGDERWVMSDPLGMFVPLVRTAGILAKIRTENVQNESQEHYRYANPFGIIMYTRRPGTGPFLKTAAQLKKKLPLFFNRNVHRGVHKPQQVDPMLSHLNPMHIITSYFPLPILIVSYTPKHRSIYQLPTKNPDRL